MRTKFFGLALILILVLAGCGGESANTVKVGWFGPLTGDTATWGQSELKTVKMLFEDYNAKGGIEVANKKYKLEVVGYDNKGDSTESVNVAKRLTSQDKVIAVLGPNGSGEAIPVAPIMNASKIPLIATVATNPKVTIREDGTLNKFMFRVCFIDPYQGNVAATYAYSKLGKRRAAVLMSIDDQYSAGLTQFFKETFEKLGGKVVEIVSYSAGEKEFRAPLTKIKAANPDIIFSPNYYTDVAMSAKQARELGITTVMMGGDGWPSDQLIVLAGNALEGCYCVNHLDFDDPTVAEFKKAYTAKYGLAPELNGYLVHDAVLMLVDAIKRSGSLDSSKIAEALESCDIQGITGHIKIGKDSHNPEGKEAAILQIQGPKMVFVEKFAGK